MASTLQALQALQEVELKLTALRQRIHAKERGVRSAKRRKAQISVALEEKHEEIKRKLAVIAHLELDIKTHDADISKLRDALNTSKTNKEYAAILTQINTDKADTGKIEDRVLEQMSEIEAMRKEEETFQAQINHEDQRLSSANSELEAFEQASQEEMEGLEQDRSEAAAAVPRETLVLFERASERHDGEVLAAVVQPHPKRDEFICDGCNMGVPLEQYVALQSRDQIQVCGSCGRMLCLEETVVR
jgi:hypothetical protein